MKRLFRVTAAAILAITFATACIRSTVNELKTDPGVAYEFRSPKPLNVAYNAAVAGFTRCLTGWVFRTSLSIKPRMADDGRSARIDYLQRGLEDGYWATVDLAAVEGGTKVNSYAIDNPGVRNLGPTLEKWIAGNTECNGLGDYFKKHQPMIE